MSRLLLLMIGAFLTACSTQTQRSSSGPGEEGRIAAPAAKPKAAAPQEQAKPQAEELKAEPQEQAKVQEEKQPAPAEPSVPEFVSEAEPAGMVPVPSPDSFEPEGADNRVSSPTMYYDEDEGTAKDDGIIAQSIYGEDDSGKAPEEGIIGQSMYYDEEEGAQKDEGIVSENRYYEEEQGAPKEEGITAQSQYYEEEQGATKSDDIVAHNVYGEDDSGRTPEETVSEPKTFPEEKIAQAEPPKPVTVLPVTVTVEAEPLFDFDKSAVRADAKTKLDELIEQLKGVTYGEVLVVGYADPIGTAMYNARLSERRALSVKAYLTSHGIPADNVRTEGRGETEEFASYESCGGLRKRKLIICLQPDRRVEVTVTAQKQP